MPIEIVRHPTIAAFLARAESFLMDREVEHNLLLGVAGKLQDADPNPEHHWLTIESGGEVIGAVMRTPPHGPALSRMPHDAVAAVADYFDGHGDPLPGIFGPAPESQQFQSAWCSRQDRFARLKTAMWLYHCDESPPSASDSPVVRSATTADQDRICEFLVGFQQEAEATKPDDFHAEAGRVIDRGAVVVVDESDHPIGMAAICRSTPNGAVIAPVFTDPQHRCRGIATACVGELMRAEFAAGKQFCCLYVDQHNPAALRAYGRLGYGRVCQFEWWTLDCGVDG